jgi:hypothetical protein
MHQATYWLKVLHYLYNLQVYQIQGPVVIDIPVNYKDNVKLSTNMLPDAFN